MKDLFQILRAPDTGQGAAAPTASPTAAAAPPTPAAAPAGTSPAGTPAAEAAPAAGTPGQAQAGTPPAAAPYWPEGLDQQLRGADEKSTLDNIAKALNGYRERDAKRLVHENADEYANLDHVKDFKVDEAQKPYFDFLKTDPTFKVMAQTAKKHGVGQQAMLEMYRDALNSMSEAGILEPLIDPVAEKAALVPENAKALPPAQQEQAVARRLQENADFLKLMETTRQLPADVREYAELMMFDTAKGHKFFEWMRGQIQGGNAAGPQSLPGQQGANTREALRAEMAALKEGDPDYKAKYKALQDRYAQLLG